MITPAHLKPGDTVSIVAPGKKISKEAIDSAIKILQSWGLTVTMAENIFSDGHSYMAGNDAQRMSDFQQALDSKNVKAIICARGGYGSTRIIDQLDFSAMQSNPKWIVGFSDITAFHLKLTSLGYQSIHATMPVLFAAADSASSVQSLRDVLFGAETEITIPSKPCNRIGRATGLTIGGNLSLIVDALATSSEPDTDGKILIIEEIEEYRYKIDRMLTQLKRADKLKSLAGLVVGHFTNIQDTELSFALTVEELILDAVKQYDFPIAFGFPSGHENPNLAWRHGAEATLTVNSDSTSLRFKEKIKGV